MIRGFLQITAGFLFATAPCLAAKQITTVVEGDAGLTCKAYLNFNEANDRPAPLVFHLPGTGVYSNGEIPDRASPEGYLLLAGKAAVLTIDKPGIDYSAKSPGYVVDDRIYNQYTQRDLIACSYNALAWALKQERATHAPVFLMGHSEGAQVITRLYAQLFDKRDPLVTGIHSLYLSGVDMDPWKDMINWQMRNQEKDRLAFWKAIQGKDTAGLRAIVSLGYPYWEDILKTESLRTTLESLARAGVPARFHFFHGLKDQNTRVEPVLEFEEWNGKRLDAEVPALRLSARYYNAGHALNLAAMNDMIFSLLAWLSQ